MNDRVFAQQQGRRIGKTAYDRFLPDDIAYLQRVLVAYLVARRARSHLALFPLSLRVRQSAADRVADARGYTQLLEALLSVPNESRAHYAWVELADILLESAVDCEARTYRTEMERD